MEKLNLPIFKGVSPAKKQLSMDDYLKFVMFNLEHTVDRKGVIFWKSRSAVNSPFYIDKNLG